MQTATNFDKSATVQYVLHEKPEHFVYFHAGYFYKTFLNGATFVKVAEMWIPAAGCPVPEKLPVANFLAFLSRNAKWIPAVLLGCAAVVITHIGLLVTDGAEFAAAWIQTFSSMMNTTLFLLALACLVAFVLSQFKKGLTIDLSGFQPVKELGAGGSSGISIAPDVAVFSESEDETQQDYNNRVKRAIESEMWVLVMPFRSEYGAIHTSGDGTASEGHVFLRSNPPHDGGEVITFGEARAAKQTFGREMWADYVAYCHEFAKRYKLWAPTAKIQEGVNPLSVILNRAAMFAVCMVLSFAGMAQKSIQVRQYLGDLRYTTDAPTGEVDFVFSGRVYTRQGGGTKTYDQLLTSAPNYTDADDSGKLVGITVDGKVVLPMRKRQGGSAQASASVPDQKIETMPTLPATKGFFESLPDSSELAIMKRQSIMERRAQWVKVEPTLEYVMWRFWQYMMLIVGIGGILWVLSKASATDAIHDLSGYPLIGNAITWLHISTKTVLFLILCVPTVMVLGADVIRYYYTQDFSFVWLFKYAIICFGWYYGFQKIIPNSPGSQGPTNRMGNYPIGNNNQRHLN
jgi:hypothetical protein